MPLRRGVPDRQTERHPGSFSIYGETVKDTAAKIVIYDPQLGRASRDWPCMRDGVYVWIRANGPLGDAIWSDTLPHELPWMFRRMWRDDTVQIAGFSIYGETAKDTAAKIVIYDPQLGRASRDWPCMRDGVYVWIRANGPLGDAIWSDTLPHELPWMFRRMCHSR